MNVSAINCTPIKPQVSFGNTENEEKLNDEEKLSDEAKLEKFNQFADSVNDEFVNSSSVKKPIAAVVSVLLAGLIAYAGGKRIAQIAINGGEKLHLNLPEMLDKSLRRVSNTVKQAATSLKNENPVSKPEKIKNTISKALTYVDQRARKLYRNVAYNGLKIAEDVVDEKAKIAAKQACAFANLGGIAGIATAFPAVAVKDSNNDGVSDILQRGQNAYTGAKTKMGQVMEKAGKISELVDLLT